MTLSALIRKRDTGDTLHLRRLDAAEQRMERAKATWTAAAQAALRHDEDAVKRVAEALQELEGAHDDLRRLIHDDNFSECPNCGLVRLAPGELCPFCDEPTPERFSGK